MPPTVNVVPEQIQYRPFFNTDPPLIAKLWRSQPVFRGLHSSVTVADLELHVFSKPYFEREGFIVAQRINDAGQNELVGFVHAAFDVQPDLSSLNRSVGIVSQLRVGSYRDFHKLRFTLDCTVVVACREPWKKMLLWLMG